MRYEEARLLSVSEDLAVFFEKTSEIAESSEVLKWILRDIKRYLNENNIALSATKISTEKLGGLIKQIKIGRVSNNAAKEILLQLMSTDRKLEDIIQEDDFLQQNDPDILSGYIDDIIAEHYEQYEAYQLGKKELFNFFVGKMMGLTKGRTRPDLIIKIVKNRLR
jgi:aspartyl-tRNA(Asn)/glutamyl-tRNA(Gln) amidotransferase subunit B